MITRKKFNQMVANSFADDATKSGFDISIAISVHPVKNEICIHSHESADANSVCKVMERAIEEIKKHHKF